MATSPVNNLKSQIGAKKSIGYPVDPSGSAEFNAGDMVCYVGGYLQAATDVTTTWYSNNFVGVAQNSSYLSIYTDATGAVVKERPESVEVLVGQVHQRKVTLANSTLTHGTALYIGADAQTVTKTKPDNSSQLCGYVYYPKGGTLTLAAGTTVDVLIIPYLPTPYIA